MLHADGIEVWDQISDRCVYCGDVMGLRAALVSAYYDPDYCSDEVLVAAERFQDAVARFEDYRAYELYFNVRVELVYDFKTC